MLSICIQSCSQSFSSLVDGHVNNILLQTVKDVNEALLQLIDTVPSTFIHSLLHNISNLIIHWIQVWAVWWPEIRPLKSNVSCCSSLMVSLTFIPGSTNINTVIPIFDTAMETITDLEKHGRMRSKRMVPVSLQ